MTVNQKPEERARDKIDQLLEQAGWSVQNRAKLNWNKSIGIAVKEYPTDAGVVDYALFVDKKPVGVIEAKREEEGHRLSQVEEQSERYADSKFKHIDNEPLPFIYETNSLIIRFTDRRDTKPRAREIFTFHRPETLKKWLKQDKSLRTRFFDIPELGKRNLRACQIKAIVNLEESFKKNSPRALVQMATGSGKTFTAITAVYRLLKFAKAKRVLFLVDTRNLGEQAEQEFRAYTPNDDNRKFTELYNVQRLQSSYIGSDSQVCISTIQRLYSILKGKELEEKAEETNPNESTISTTTQQDVVYSAKLPIEFFDFIIIDECHRSIYNVWKQVLDYFDAFLIGLTATPDKRTFGFFNENVVSEYTHEEAVTDGVNVGYDVYTIETEITSQGSKIYANEYIDKRDKLTRQKRWEQAEEEIIYGGKQLNQDVVNPSQIRTIIKAFKEKLPEIFPNRGEIPKTLIFAKNDNHAEDIIEIVREEFAEGNAFCKKVTYQSEDPKSILAQFRNDYYPRIAVTVDMIATGTDVRPLECLIFMRDVKSSSYFEQMKGRGTRTLDGDNLKKVTPSAKSSKTHFIIIDAVGVTKSVKTDSRPLERKKGIPIKDLMISVLMGVKDEDTFVSLASRLTRLDRQITDDDKQKIEEKAGGLGIPEIAKKLLMPYDADAVLEKAREIHHLNPEDTPTIEQKAQAIEQLADEVSLIFTGELIETIEQIRKNTEQIIDVTNLDAVKSTGWDKQARDKAEECVRDFASFIEANKDEIVALSIFYNAPYRRREITYTMIEELYQKLKTEKPNLAPLRVWKAYEQLEEARGKEPLKELTALVALVRRVVGIDDTLTNYENKVDQNFKDWVFKKQAGALKFNEEQMTWLRMIKEHITQSFHIEKDDLDYAPFDAKGGLGKMYQLFGAEIDNIINEINEALVA
jgi:type I restriction enzyme R subunit